MGWDDDGEPFYVGKIIAPAGIPPAHAAIQARRAGDRPGTLRYAQQALDADRYANEERAAGRTAHRSNISGNAWSAFYEAITGRSSGW